MMAAIPEVYYRTMGEELIYNALRDSHYISSLPAYVEGSYWFPEECVEEVRRIPLSLQADIIWCVLEEAHERCRSQHVVMESLLTEECFTCLNVFAPLPLAGPKVYNVGAKHFRRLFGRAGFALDEKLDTSEFGQQMTQMEELEFGQPPLLDSVFVINRRRFVQEKGIVDYGDLLGYVSEIQNDVFGVVRGPLAKKCSPVKNTALKIAHALYDDENARSFQFRVARQIVAANGNMPPLSW